MIHAGDTALQEREETLDAVGMGLASHVFARAVRDDLMVLVGRERLLARLSLTETRAYGAGRLGTLAALRGGDAEPVANLQRIGILDVQHPARLVGFRLRRRVQDEWTHADDASRANETVNGRNLAHETLDVRLGKHAERVRSGQHTEWPVVLSGVVEVQPKGDDV